MRTAAARVLEGQQAVARAGALVARGRYALAAEEYRRALEVQPADASVHNQLGICYQRLSNEAMARREYERALELRPGVRRGVEQRGHPRAVAQAVQGRGARLQEGDRAQALARDAVEEPRQRLPLARAAAGGLRGVPGGLPSRPDDPRGAGGRASPPPASTPPRSTCSSRSCSPARDRPTPRSTSSRAPRRPASATTGAWSRTPTSAPSSRTRAGARSSAGSSPYPLGPARATTGR